MFSLDMWLALLKSHNIPLEKSTAFRVVMEVWCHLQQLVAKYKFATCLRQIWKYLQKFLKVLLDGITPTIPVSDVGFVPFLY